MFLYPPSPTPVHRLKSKPGRDVPGGGAFGGSLGGALLSGVQALVKRDKGESASLAAM